jgi:hypothetical protein
MTPYQRIQALVTAAALCAGAVTAQVDPTIADPGAVAVQLPVVRVVVFTNGVGYVEHAGTVQGAQELDLPVPVEHMDDLLQSLVLQDEDGGTIRPVRYPSSDPLPRLLASYAIDLSRDPDLSEVLEQARGEPLEVELDEVIAGTLVGVERVQSAGEAPRFFLTLSTEAGLVRLPLDEVRRLRFQRASLQADLDSALSAIARYRDARERPVRLHFEGDGERRVRVGYLREMPVWKTSYRLLLHGDGTADLQGWAIFDNPTDLDFVDVALSFVAGRPFTFVTELYQPVYAPRARVRVETGAGIVAPLLEADAPARPSVARAAGLADAVAAEAAPAPQLSGAGVTAMAEGERAGASFAYHVVGPVTVGRHESAMVPIVEARLDAPALSVFDPATTGLNPLRGARLSNVTGLHLAAGPLAVFDAGGFAGMARVSDVVPGDTRLVTYAVDQDLEVVVTADREPERIVSVTVQQGVVETQVRHQRRTSYRVVARGELGRFLVIEHQTPEGFEVVSPSPPPARTATRERFGVEVVTGAADPDSDDVVPTHLRCTAEDECVLTVVMERLELRRLSIDNLSGEQIAVYLENVELDDDTRALLEQVLELQTRIAALTRSVAQERQRVDQIFRDQDRIRQNMAALDRASDLYARYVRELEAQEDLLAAVWAAAADLERELGEAQEALDALIRGVAPEPGH